MEKDKLFKNDWERVLWKKQNFPDNYVGNSFFRVSTKSHTVTFGQAFYGSILVAQEICSCVGLVAIFWGISEKLEKTTLILALSAFLAFTGYIIFHLSSVIHGKQGKMSLFTPFYEDMKVVIFTIILNWFASPIIKTLTASVATDTIQACTTGLLFLHLVFHPYGADVSIVNSTMSHNLGLFASICLASRLDSDLDVFTLMIVAVISFHLLPNFRSFCEVSLGKKFVSFFTAAQFIAVLICVMQYTTSLCFLFITIVLFVTAVAPLMFIYLQPYRKNIYGPWDEALINEK